MLKGLDAFSAEGKDTGVVSKRAVYRLVVKVMGMRYNE